MIGGETLVAGDSLQADQAKVLGSHTARPGRAQIKAIEAQSRLVNRRDFFVRIPLSIPSVLTLFARAASNPYVFDAAGGSTESAQLRESEGLLHFTRDWWLDRVPLYHGRSSLLPWWCSWRRWRQAFVWSTFGAGLLAPPSDRLYFPNACSKELVSLRRYEPAN